MNEPQQNPAPEVVSVPQGRSTAAPKPAGLALEPRSPAQIIKDIALFFAAPFITIAYLALFPLIGMRMLIQTNSQARHRRNDAD
jgi:hypothetical protein